MKCLIEICDDRFPYINITNFAEHMKTNHIKIYKLEDRKCKPPNLDVNWIYFIHTEQEKIKCLICEKTVTDESTD